MQSGVRKGFEAMPLDGDAIKSTSLMDAPFHINWNFSYACNFNCKHCYSRSRATEDELSSANKLLVADNIARNRVFSVNLGGGEPLLSEDILPIIDYLASRHVQVSITSNGWDIPEFLVHRLKESGLSRIVLSLDDADPKRHDALRRRPGSHASCLAATALFVSCNIPVRFSTVMMRQNFDVLEQIVCLAQLHDCEGVEFKRLRLQGNARDEQNLSLTSEQESALYERIHVLKEHYPLDISLVYGEKEVEDIDGGCPCGKTTLCIMSNGDIAPCVYNPHVLGNALKDDIAVLWRSSRELQYFRTHFTCHGLEDIYV